MSTRTLKTIGTAVLFLAILIHSAVAQRPNRSDIPANISQATAAHPSAVKVARLHYSGGGDWYWGNSALPNLLNFISDNTDFPVDTVERVVTIDDVDLLNHPFRFAAGHGLISCSAEEEERLRRYLA